MKIKLASIIAVAGVLLYVDIVKADSLPLQKVIVKPNVVVSATIGIPQMTLWGYGPASASLELSGVAINQTTISDSTGMYIFDPVYLPYENTNVELCVTAIDNEKRTTPPTCIPSIKTGNYYYNIGPVIIPPTLSLGAPQTQSGGQVSAQGQTIPNTNVEIKLARPEINKGILSFQIIKTALAYYVPSFIVNSDKSGYYSFNMPTTTGETWRVFTITDFKAGAKSPKSNTLKFETVSKTTYVWQSLLLFILSFFVWPKILILIIILLAIAILIVLIKDKVKSNKRKQNVSK